MKMRTGSIRCEKCKRHIALGAPAVRIYGRLWHLTPCAVEYRRDRARQRGELQPAA